MKYLYIIVILILGIYASVGITTMERNLVATDSVYDYFLKAKKNPDNFLIVTGMNQKPFETECANSLSKLIGVKVINENDISNPDNSYLIFIGNKYSNVLLDKSTSLSFDKKQAIVAVENNNLFVILSSKEQSDELISAFENFEGLKHKFSYNSIIIKKSNGLLNVIILVLLLIPVVILILEWIRCYELNNQKNQLIQKYIKTYKEKGYDEEYIRNWLIEKGYLQDEVKKEEK